MPRALNTDPVIRNRDVKDALGDAFTRAVHWAPEALLQDFGGERRNQSCRRLAMRVMTELAADGWRELRPRLDLPGLEDAIVDGMMKAGKTILASIPHARCCNGKMLDNIGLHFGELTFREMQKTDIAIESGYAPPSLGGGGTIRRAASGNGR